MFDDLNRCLGWVANTPLKTGLLLIESDQTDGGFLLHHFISMYLKNKLPVCLLTLAQTFSHYAQAGMKIGANLDKAKTEGRICHIDLMTDFLQKYLKLNETVACNGHIDSLQNLFLNIKSEIEKIFSQCENSLLVIDDLSMLLGLGFTLSDVQNFVHYLNVYAKTNGVLFVTVTPTFAHHDYQHLQQVAAHYAGTILTLKSLPSGYSKDVHGHLQVFKKAQATSSIWQYKITDKNLQLFAKGTSTAVL